MNTSERARKLNIIRQFPSTLRALVAPLSEKQLTTAFIEDEWTVAQIVHHCADSHMNSYIRLKLMLTEDNPPLKPYDEPLWAQFDDGTTASLEHTLSLLDGLHARWTATFDQLTDDQWTRTGTHLADGEIQVADLIDIYSNHCRAHLDQIRRVLHAQPDRVGYIIRRKHVKLMRHTMITFENIARELTQEEATTWRDGGDGWTVLEVLCHLRDFDRFFKGRVELMVAEESPTLPMYDHEQLAIDKRYNEQDLMTVIEEMKVSRAAYVDLFNQLENSAESYMRTGIHPEYGEWTILESLVQVGHHDNDHLQQISRIIAEKKVVADSDEAGD